MAPRGRGDGEKERWAESKSNQLDLLSVSTGAVDISACRMLLA